MTFYDNIEDQTILNDVLVVLAQISNDATYLILSNNVRIFKDNVLDGSRYGVTEKSLVTFTGAVDADVSDGFVVAVESA